MPTEHNRQGACSLLLLQQSADWERAAGNTVVILRGFAMTRNIHFFSIFAVPKLLAVVQGDRTSIPSQHG
jgi:hypothetical protein